MPQGLLNPVARVSTRIFCGVLEGTLVPVAAVVAAPFSLLVQEAAINKKKAQLMPACRKQFIVSDLGSSQAKEIWSLLHAAAIESWPALRSSTGFIKPILSPTDSPLILVSFANANLLLTVGHSEQNAQLPKLIMKKILIVFCSFLSITDSFAQQNTGTIKTSLVALYADMPKPTALPTQTTPIEPTVEAYQAHLNRFAEDLSTTFLKHNDTYQTYVKEGEHGLQKKTAQQANQNEILAQMGGLEKVSEMSEAEAQAAAMAAVQKKMQAPAASAGPAVNANMNGLMQDMMKDPQLRARFEKMSEKDKQAFLQSYMAQEIPNNNPSHKKTLAQKNQLTQANTAAQALTRLQKEVMSIGNSYDLKTTQLNQTMQRKRDSLKQWYDKEYEAIPLVVEGEGRWKDSKKLNPLEDKYQQELEKLAKQETSQKISFWQEYYAKVKPVLVQFETDHLSKHEMGKDQQVDQYFVSVTGDFVNTLTKLSSEALLITPRLQP